MITLAETLVSNVNIFKFLTGWVLKLKILIFNMKPELAVNLFWPSHCLKWDKLNLVLLDLKFQTTRWDQSRENWQFLLCDRLVYSFKQWQALNFFVEQDEINRDGHGHQSLIPRLLYLPKALNGRSWKNNVWPSVLGNKIELKSLALL